MKCKIHILISFYLLLTGLLSSFHLHAQKEDLDSLQSIFVDVSEPVQKRIDIGIKLINLVSVVNDNLTISEQTERLILANTTPDTYTKNLNFLFDVLTMRAVLYKLGQNNDKALEVITASQSVAKTINDKDYITFSKASELFQAMPFYQTDSLVTLNLQLYKLFQTRKKLVLAGLSLQNSGDVCYIHKDYANAINYYKKSLSLQQINHNKLISALLNTQIGQCYLATGANELARSHFDLAYQLHLLEGNAQEQAINLYYTAKALFNKKDFKTAEEIINKVRLVTSQLEDSYFKKLIAVQLSAVANLKQEEQLRKLFSDSLNLLNVASVLPLTHLSSAADEVYLQNIALLKTGNKSTDNAHQKDRNGKGLAWLLLISTLVAIGTFGVWRFRKNKKNV